MTSKVPWSIPGGTKLDIPIGSKVSVDRKVVKMTIAAYKLQLFKKYIISPKESLIDTFIRRWISRRASNPNSRAKIYRCMTTSYMNTIPTGIFLGNTIRHTGILRIAEWVSDDRYIGELEIVDSLRVCVVQPYLIPSSHLLRDASTRYRTPVLALAEHVHLMEAEK